MPKLKPVTPGELLREEFLRPMGLSQYRLAKETGVSRHRISAIVAGKATITADTDLHLCRFFGLSNGYWLRAQAAYDSEVAEDYPSQNEGGDVSIFEREQELFERWAGDESFKRWAGDESFIPDGVACEETYLESTPKILFVLKETNDPSGRDGDLREFMRNGGTPKTWNNITRWVEGIRNLPNDTPWEVLEYIDEERRQKALRTIAAINLKKTPGGSTADEVRIRQAAENDKLYIKEQIKIYKADYVIFCGTSDIFHCVVDQREVEWRRTGRRVWYHEPYPDRYMIKYYHPQAHYPHPLLHYGLVDAVREIEKHRQSG